MANLPRSEVSFRRSGSSGLVWEDRFISEELNKSNQQQQEQQHSTTENNNDNNNLKELKVETTIQRSRSTGASRGFRTGKVSPAIEPPSPKVSACGFCGAFGKKGQRSNNGKRRSR